MYVWILYDKSDFYASFFYFVTRLTMTLKSQIALGDNR